jgi:hypothetical protein
MSLWTELVSLSETISINLPRPQRLASLTRVFLIAGKEKLA